MMLNNILHRRLIKILLLMSIRLTPLHLLGSKMSPFFGTGTTWTSFHYSNSKLSFQNSRMKLKWTFRFFGEMALKALDTGAIQSPCLTPTVWLIVSSVFLILRTTFRSWYILAMLERSFGGGTILFQNLEHQSVVNSIKRLDEVLKHDVSR